MFAGLSQVDWNVTTPDGCVHNTLCASVIEPRASFAIMLRVYGERPGICWLFQVKWPLNCIIDSKRTSKEIEGSTDACSLVGQPKGAGARDNGACIHNIHSKFMLRTCP